MNSIDEGHVHPFKGIGTGKKGQRYMAVIVPIEHEESVSVGESPTPPSADSAGEHADKPRKKFDEMLLSQQCAIRCNEPAFQNWLVTETTEGAADILKVRLGIQSRRKLDTDPAAAERWKQLETQFLMETGRMASP